MWVVVTVMLLGGVTVGRKRRILSRVMSYRDIVKQKLLVFFALEGHFGLRTFGYIGDELGLK